MLFMKLKVIPVEMDKLLGLDCRLNLWNVKFASKTVKHRKHGKIKSHRPDDLENIVNLSHHSKMNAVAIERNFQSLDEIRSIIVADITNNITVYSWPEKNALRTSRT